MDCFRQVCNTFNIAYADSDDLRELLEKMTCNHRIWHILHKYKQMQTEFTKLMDELREVTSRLNSLQSRRIGAFPHNMRMHKKSWKALINTVENERDHIERAQDDLSMKYRESQLLCEHDMHENIVFRAHTLMYESTIPIVREYYNMII